MTEADIERTRRDVDSWVNALWRVIEDVRDVANTSTETHKESGSDRSRPRFC